MDSRMVKPKALPKSLLLKDYLLDDLSSCSSNGFKSFPRKQCCSSTVRFLIEMDLNKKQQPCLLRNPSKSALATFQSIIAAVKRLPFGAASSPEKKRTKKSILPRNLSKKILKKSSFWKRKSDEKEIQRRKSFDQLLKDDPLDSSNSSIRTTSGSKGESSLGSDFTTFSRANSSSEVNLNSPEQRNDVVEMMKKGDQVSTVPTTSSAATNSSTKKQWSANEEKEQFSPVSVLDCPFDDDEEVSSPFKHGWLPQLEPVKLSKRFASLPESDNKCSGSPLPTSIEDATDNSDVKEEGEESQAEQKALVLLNQMDTLTSNDLKVKADILLLDFFREKIIAQNYVHSGRHSFDVEVLEEAENWIKGRKPHEMYLGWEVPRNREVYTEDMEKGSEWKSLYEENREVGLELEDEVFATLMNELLIDISSTATL